MILFFVDDSGNSGTKLDHPVEQVHWLVALAVDESQVRELDRAVHACCDAHFGAERARQAEFEVKGAELFGGRGCAAGLGPDARIACYRELLALLAPHSAHIFVRGIHKPRHAARAVQRGYAPSAPYDVAFQFLIERIDEWLESRAPQTRGLIVADEQQEAGRRMIHQFNQWAHTGTSLGYRARSISSLLPSLHYVRSVDSRLVQLADCVAYLRNRIEKAAHNPATRSDAVMRELWTVSCAPLVIDDRVWP